MPVNGNVEVGGLTYQTAVGNLYVSGTLSTSGSITLGQSISDVNGDLILSASTSLISISGAVEFNTPQRANIFSQNSDLILSSSTQNIIISGSIYATSLYRTKMIAGQTSADFGQTQVNLGELQVLKTGVDALRLMNATSLRASSGSQLGWASGDAGSLVSDVAIARMSSSWIAITSGTGNFPNGNLALANAIITGTLMVSGSAQISGTLLIGGTGSLTGWLFTPSTGPNTSLNITNPLGGAAAISSNTIYAKNFGSIQLGTQAGFTNISNTSYCFNFSDANHINIYANLSSALNFDSQATGWFTSSIYVSGNLNVSGNINIQNSGTLQWGGLTVLSASSAGQLQIFNPLYTNGSSGSLILGPLNNSGMMLINSSGGTLNVLGATGGNGTLNITNTLRVSTRGAINSNNQAGFGLSIGSDNNTFPAQFLYQNQGVIQQVGTIAIPVKTVKAQYNVLTGADYILLADASAASFGIVLPVNNASGSQYIIKKIDNTANAVVISGTIDGATNTSISTQNTSITLVASGSAYYVI